MTGWKTGPPGTKGRKKLLQRMMGCDSITPPKQVALLVTGSRLAKVGVKGTLRASLAKSGGCVRPARGGDAGPIRATTRHGEARGRYVGGGVLPFFVPPC